MKILTTNLILTFWILVFGGCGGQIVGIGVTTPDGEGFSCSAPDDQCLQTCESNIGGVVTHVTQFAPGCTPKPQPLPE